MIPVFASVGPADPGPNTDPIPVDDLAALAPGFTHTLDALVNDADHEHDLLRIIAVSDPPHGTASVISCAGLYNPNSDCIQYREDAGYLGLDAITYTVSDGRGGTASATYHLAVGNVVPVVATIAPDSGPVTGGQSVRITGANFLYRSHVALVCGSVILPLNVTSLTDAEILATTPAGFAGVCDVQVRTLFAQAGILAGAYTYDGGAGNQPPVATDDEVTVRQTNSVSIAVLANDTDADAGDVLHVVANTQPAHGRLDMIVADVFEYTPGAGHLGADSFTYTVADGSGATSTATVLITVTEGVAAVRLNVLFEDGGLALGEQACFELWQGASLARAAQCIDAGQNVVVFNDVPLRSVLGIDRLPAVCSPSLPATPTAGSSCGAAAGPGVGDCDGSTEIVTVEPRLRKLRVGERIRPARRWGRCVTSCRRSPHPPGRRFRTRAVFRCSAFTSRSS